MFTRMVFLYTWILSALYKENMDAYISIKDLFNGRTLSIQKVPIPYKLQHLYDILFGLPANNVYSSLPEREAKLLLNVCEKVDEKLFKLC